VGHLMAHKDRFARESARHGPWDGHEKRIERNSTLPVFFLGMLTHYLRKLFLCKSNHKSVSLKLNLPGSFLRFKVTDFFLLPIWTHYLGHYQMRSGLQLAWSPLRG
jgi:hypothetical protein